jgi:hypothetical protein
MVKSINAMPTELQALSEGKRWKRDKNMGGDILARSSAVHVLLAKHGVAT